MEDMKKMRSEEDSKNENGGGDKISNLPEFIINHILSFLPTKDVVATSILATTWRHLWTSVQTLDFQYSGRAKTTFFEFVSKVLRSHDSSDILKFRLNYWTFDKKYLDQWIPILVSHKVQDLELTLSSCSGKPILSNCFCDHLLPQCIFTCESLRRLKIQMGSTISSPAWICLSALKVLHLENVEFSVENSLQELTLELPLLEELVIKRCAWLGINVVKVCAPRLQFLTIPYDSGGPRNDCEISIQAEKLTSLTRFLRTL